MVRAMLYECSCVSSLSSLLLLLLQLEPSLDASFVFGATSMLGHSPQTPQEMYPNAKGG